MDELLLDLAREGWLINNCYQTDARLYRVSLRRPTPTGDWFTEIAEAETMLDAFAECMSKLLDAEFVLDAPIVGTIAPDRDLASMLGIRRTAQPILRRL